MLCEGLAAWGAKRWIAARAGLLLVAAATSLALAGCGNGDGHKKAVQCHADSDCDASELGVCGTVSCEQDRCVLDNKPDGHRCNDEDPLTGDDACLDGICAGVIHDCEDDLGPCLKAVHDAVTDECVVEPVDDGVPCDDADACTQVDTCQQGTCTGDSPKACAAADDCHVAGKCDPESGKCSAVAAADDTPCDDGQACTSDDSCQAGVCAGAAVECDDGLSCSVDSCDQASGACAADMAACTCAVDAECDDGDACNGSETCSASKLCQPGEPVVCAPSTDACQANRCLADTGECQLEPVKDGTACDDLSACTAGDSCQAGQCQGLEPAVCAPLDQCHVAGICDALTGACSNPQKPANAPCNDGNACTATDTCQAGACVGAGQASCAASDQCHLLGVCDTQTGICSKPAKQNGVACNDANACTTGDACQNGSCAPTGTVLCAAIDSCHDAGTCNTQSGVCSTPAKANGTPCGDGLTCTAPDTCTAGKCGGTAVVCDDGVACTTDSCSEKLGGCTTNSAGCGCATSADCDDGNPCNGVETCNLTTLQCKLGTAVDCSALNDACNVGACSPTTGTCVPSPKANGSACDDGNKCTQGSSCQAGACLGSNPVSCVASDQCHDAGACNPATGACSNPLRANGTTCNDGNFCTNTDSCQSGICTGSNPTVCPAPDQCHTIGTCNTVTGVCSLPAPKLDGTGCSDGSLCSKTDTCQGGVCTGSDPVVCVASDQCHVAGVCNGKTGTCSNPPEAEGAKCDDGLKCTLSDSCQGGVCGGSAVTCPLPDQCHTAGACDPKNGACSNPLKANGSPCSDGSLCTGTDTCQAGACSGGAPVTCVASDQCHNAGSCDSKTGLCSDPAKADNTPCTDGKSCTTGDKCLGGVCTTTPVACDDKIACTVDSCVEPTGCKFDGSKCQCNKDADCDDGDACTGTEKCNLTSLTCIPGTAVSCSGLDDACNLGACNKANGTCSAKPRADGTGCDDGSACTKSDGCVAGKCVGASPVTCPPASDQCHDVGSCDSKTGTCSNPIRAGTCNDGDKCTTVDTCTAGVCVGSSPVTCPPASDQCHLAGSCDSKTGTCSNPIKTGACNDGDGCTQVDTCVAGVCTGSSPVQCGVSDQCHSQGVCDSKSGTCSNPPVIDGTGCDDSNQCTLKDACKGGVCGGTAVVCKPLGACYLAGTCDTKSGLCSTPFAPVGNKCDDTNACTSGELCDGKGTCGGGAPVSCQPPGDPCKTNTCNASLGCVQGDQPTGTLCDDGKDCTQLDQCGKGACIGGDPRDNTIGDWADDPGRPSSGPISVDIFSDKKGQSHITGIYRRTFYLNDKEVPKTATPLPLPTTQSAGIYWAVYDDLGAVKKAVNIGGAGINVDGVATGSVTVEHAAGHRDGSFTLLGIAQGAVEFGLVGATQPIGAKNSEVYVAHYLANGSLSWLAQFTQGGKTTFEANSVAAFDDGSVIAIGSTSGVLAFNDSAGTKFGAGTAQRGIWAARLDSNGIGQWANLVVYPNVNGAVDARAVATHADDGASLTGTFAISASLGPGLKTNVAVKTNDKDAGRDVWFQKLGKDGAIVWGGRAGGLDLDVAGDVAAIDGGGTLLLANLRGASPNAESGKTSSSLNYSNSSGLQAHVLALTAAGVPTNDGLIANKEAGDTRGYQLKRDAAGFYAVAGSFQLNAECWSDMGFGGGPPTVTSKFPIASLYQGTQTLFAARVDEKSTFHWARQVGGDASGMLDLKNQWDLVMTALPTHSLTLAGMFNKPSALFGDVKPETLQADPELGNPFVVHVNSEAEHDYCGP